MEELLNQISAELSRNDHDPIKISVIEIEYAHGQMKVGPKQANTASWKLPISAKDSTASLTYQLSSKRKKVEHWDT